MTTTPRSKAIVHLEDEDLLMLGYNPWAITDTQFEEIARYISEALDTVLGEYIIEAVDHATSVETRSL
jgi:hypothetical protein